ncbi:hypothetical protein O181_093174 [Austropuccinia psidii MF-1]|uniref:Zn(2)-C6 fungal-type domain-containing protein n=1 Tax=Austropuccinia psidii MF-1 TaxID=1389203 RepID=A0A9Q3P9L0_9BASI|nr:hypothetical protein [Austropuccinia psidii MF-1]
MSYTLCTKRGIPCICSSTTTEACDACLQAHKKCFFIVRPFRPHGQRSSCPRHPCKDSFVVNDDETISERKWTPGPQAARWEQFRTISPVPSSTNVSTPPPRPPSDGHFTPQPEQIYYPSNEGWRWQEDIQAWADCHHVLSPMGFKCKNSPVPSLPWVQTLRQPTAGPSGTQWSEELLRKPPMPGPSPSSQPPEDVLTHEPEPEVAPTQST